MHIVRAAGELTRERVFVVIGSQAALFQFPELSGTMVMSTELDIYPQRAPQLAEIIEGAIGRDSPFHQQFGYYADGVGPETARLPSDWFERAITVGVPGYEQTITVIAPEIHDLAVSKLLAGRENDLDWLAGAVSNGILELVTVRLLLPLTNANAEEISLAEARIARIDKERAT